MTELDFKKILPMNRMKWKCSACKIKKKATTSTTSPTPTSASPLNVDTEVLGRGGKQSDRQQIPGNTGSLQDRDALVSAISNQVLEAIKTELPQMISRILKTELSSIKDDLLDFRQSVDFLSTMHDEMKSAIETLAKANALISRENLELKSTVSELSDRLNNLEQHMRENNLEMQGVPEHHNENLPNLLKQCSRVIGHDLKEDAIVKCTRVAKLNKESKLPRSIIVKFRCVEDRDSFYSAVYRYNKSNSSDKLNTSLLGIAGDKKPVYVSEHLSPSNKSLHAAARKRAKELGYKFTWVKSGRIYVRKTIDSKYILIKNNKSLALIS
ncbi:uncharacterized protein LOC123690447 [Pieris rapae]|uniref:uncharacterized protein LOC123690447 n=1 Tax=Pieris rapae TaxID=64459 RepID=UPI001E27CEC9|nr:uncharacterized protein LOC123690447 [Pieris rapae]